MSEKRDYYEVLEVERTADDATISSAYRKLAMRYHPDRNPGDEEAVAKFKEAAEAFDVLHDPEKRARYDRYGHSGMDPNMGGFGGGAQFHDVNDIFSAFGDMFGFGDLFGGGRGGRGNRPRRGADVRCAVKLTLKEAADGVKKNVEFRRREKCKTCDGTGAKPGTAARVCDFCGGRGQVIQSQGIFSVQSTCPKCHGSGKLISDPCPDCQGSGLKAVKVTREIEIPAGIDNQTQMRIQGEGESSPNGGPNGDCYVSIMLEEHPIFKRDGNNLICHVPVSYAQAVLGAKIDIPTLYGPEPFDLPAGTPTGEVFRLRGKGMPELRTRRKGDLLAQVYIDVPKKLTKEHEELLRKLAALEETNVSPERKGFLSKIKEMFKAADTKIKETIDDLKEKKEQEKK